MRILGTVASSSREVPNAPTIGTATDVGTGRTYTPQNGGATVTFTAPTFNGGLPILDYTATSSPSGFTATGAGSPLTVNGLAPSTSYTFTVKARNAVGSSLASAASNSITATTVPQAPTIGTATDGGTGTTVSVAFTTNATGGKAITSYTVTSSPGGITATGAASPITVSGLTAGTAYTFTVTATNANGTSAASAASNSVTPASPSSFDSIATINGNGTTSTVTFSSIPSTYKSLQIRCNILETANTGEEILLRLNGDSGSNYPYHYVQGVGVVQAGYGGLNQRIAAQSAMSSIYPNVVIIEIIDYASTSKYKTVRILSGTSSNGTSNDIVALSSGLWMSTAAINSITLYDQTTANKFATTSKFALYGVK